MSLVKTEKRIQRHKRVRTRVAGTAQVPRLCVFRSQNHVYAQLIDDVKGNTLASSSDLELAKSKVKNQKSKIQIKTQKEGAEVSLGKPLRGKVAVGYEVGRDIAARALEKHIDKVAFDRGGYKYHGIVKALADGAREGGLKF